MLNRTASKPRLTIAAASALTLVLGSIHAFSVFVPEWERQTSADRAQVSLIYSLALMSLTMAVLLGYRVYARIGPAWMFCCSGVMSALGLLAAARMDSVAGLYVFYGLIFGAGNGLGYGYALQLAGQAMPQSRGKAMAVVTAFYAVGATLAPALFLTLISAGGNKLALMVAAMVVLVVSLVAGFTVWLSAATFTGETVNSLQPLDARQRAARLLLWLGYGAGVVAGLMIIGHAYAIASWLSLTARAISIAPVAVAAGNMTGGFLAGYLADRLSSRSLLIALPIGSAVGLALIWSTAGDFSGLAGLALTGLCYGALIAVYPVAVSGVFGATAAPRIYGQIFTAWGVAGLLGPWLSGWLYDQSESYTASLAIAMVMSVVSIVAVARCFSADH